MSESSSQTMTIFGQALECACNEERATFLERACGGDALLHAKVKELLQAHQDVGNFLRGSSTPIINVLPQVECLPPSHISGYEVLEELGRGGMSVVYKARQTHPGRFVALKMMLHGGHAGPERQARLLAEADAVARLEHQGIVGVYEVGRHDGVPFLALEFIDGGTLSQRTAGEPQPPRRAAELVEKIARSMDYAHSRGVVHRDLKPSNILLTSDGQPKITDFGLAKHERPELTATGALLGTPSYMAPEQAAGDKCPASPVTDVYALGTILYELITGRPPFRGATTLETLEQVRTQEVVAPIQLQARTPTDLNTICLKCLHKEPHRRYATAGELADELKRYLEGKPVRARPVGTAERVWRWSRRNPAWAAMLATVATLLLVVFIGGSLGIVRLNDALEQSRTADRATQEQLFDSLLAQAQANCYSRRAGRRFKSLELVAEASRLAHRLSLPEDRSLELRNTAILALSLPDLYVAQTWEGLPDASACVDFDESLTTYAWMDPEGNCEVHRVGADSPLYRLPAPPGVGKRLASPSLSRDGRFLALFWFDDIGGYSGKLHLLRLTEGTRPELLLEDENVVYVEFDNASRRMVLAQLDGAVRVYDLDRHPLASPWTFRPSTPFRNPVGVTLHPTEPWVAVTSYFGPNVVEIRDYRSGALVKNVHLPQNSSAAVWSPDGQTLAVPEGDGGDIWLYDGPGWTNLRTLHTRVWGNRVTFGPKGDRLASVAWGGYVFLFDTGTERVLAEAHTAIHSMGRLRFSRDGSRLAAACDGRQLGIWNVGDARECRLIPILNDSRVDVWSDNRLLAAPTTGHIIALYDLETGQRLGQLPIMDPDRVHFIPGTPDIPGALTAESSDGLLSWPIEPSRETPGTLRLGPRQRLSPIHASWMSHSRDGRLLAGASRTIPRFHGNAGAWILRVDRPDPPVRRLEAGKDILYVALSPDGDLAVTSPQLTGVNRVWDVATGHHLKDLGTGSGTFPRFSPDGKWLAVSGDTGALYSVGSWEEGMNFNGYAQFSPDSRSLAVRTAKHQVRLLDIRRRLELARLEVPNQFLGRLPFFTPDGTRLITTGNYSADGGIYVWDLRLIRRQLKEMDLDWDAPDYPAETPAIAAPLRLEVVP
jgi:WD40 repeat protein/tRNA A-37 threonylcarbamoyl transferase component Bud32